MTWYYSLMSFWFVLASVEVLQMKVQAAAQQQQQPANQPKAWLWCNHQQRGICLSLIISYYLFEIFELRYENKQSMVFW